MALLRYIHGYHLATGGVSPSLSECARALGKGKTLIFDRLGALERKGAIRRLALRNRGIEVLTPPSLPMINGTPLYAVPIALSRRA
jgi:SOS-response transcriptional repressor LexA